MTRPLQRLTYFSQSLIRGPDWFIEGEIARLLAVARDRNRQMAITGMLLFNDGCFAQILEGAAEDLDTLLRSITADPRHAGVTVMQRGLIDIRAFPDWNMHYIAHAAPIGAKGGPGLFERLSGVAQARA
ncbi:BLUF domain-containing protein [Humitalea sp. 24SJ18S-53]|uniref:BLUF domain-containing protein n=1 Tax=Humitalea sp. 24SJ18S-53 TaxID=3422307 RepID=UPI003D67FC1B